MVKNLVHITSGHDLTSRVKLKASQLKQEILADARWSTGRVGSGAELVYQVINLDQPSHLKYQKNFLGGKNGIQNVLHFIAFFFGQKYYIYAEFHIFKNIKGFKPFLIKSRVASL